MSLRTIPIFIALTALLVPRASAVGKPELDLELDAYYTAYSLNLPFSDKKDSAEADAGEVLAYRQTLQKALTPNYLVLEASVNPMPWTGVLIRRHAASFYRGAQAGNNLNLVQAATAGFEEPYAASLFLGKVTDFSQGKKTLGRSRKGYVGYLASFGTEHIVTNQMVADKWFELEAKIKGDLAMEKRKMSWSLRAGHKNHANGDIADTFYFGIRRNRVDYEKTPYSFLLSSALDYRVDFNRKGFGALSHYVMLEKNLPVTRHRWTFSLGLGYLWQSKDKYSGALAGLRRQNDSQILLRPNLVF